MTLPDFHKQEELLEAKLPFLHRGKGPLRRQITEAHEALFMVLCGILKPALVVEVGAHAAEFSSKIRQACPDAKVVALEANPAVHAQHSDRLTTEGILYLNLAALDRATKAEFKVPHNKSGRADTTMSSVNTWKNAKSHDSFFVHALPLDDIPGITNGNCCLWVDVEGAAATALRGATKTLQNTEAVYIELEMATRWSGAEDSKVAHELLQTAGLVPLSRDIQQPKWQYNAIYVRPKWLENSFVQNAFSLYLGFSPSRSR